MSKTISISKELEESIVWFCNDELSWHIHECEAEEYDTEIRAQLELLRLLGHNDMADRYEADYESCLSDED